MIMTQTEIISHSFVIAEMILQSTLFKEYEAAKYALRTDVTAQELIWEFNKCKDEYEEVQRFGSYHPDYQRFTKEVRERKRQLDLYEPIARFKKSERALDELLSDISVTLAHAVSTSIKVPTGNPFFDSMSCSGGCSSGGSCGCNKG